MTKRGWTKEGITLTNGSQILTLGDEVNYVATGTTYKEKWRILGIGEDGGILLISANNIDTLSLCGKKGYRQGVKRLHKICKNYGKGRGALYARSVIVEDVFKIRGIFNRSLSLDRNSENKEEKIKLSKVFEKFKVSSEYWIAQSFSEKQAFSDYNKQGIFSMCESNLILHQCNLKEENEYEKTLGVRAVVALKPNVQFKKSNDGVYTF